MSQQGAQQNKQAQPYGQGMGQGQRAGFGAPPANNWSTSISYGPGSMGMDKPGALWGGASTSQLQGNPNGGSWAGGMMPQTPGLVSAPGGGGWSGGAFGQTGNMGQPAQPFSSPFTSGYGSGSSTMGDNVGGPGWSMDQSESFQNSQRAAQGQADYRTAHPEQFDQNGVPAWRNQLAQTRQGIQDRAANFQPWVNRSLKPQSDPAMNVVGDPRNAFQPGMDVQGDPRLALMRQRGLLG